MKFPLRAKENIRLLIREVLTEAGVQPLLDSLWKKPVWDRLSVRNGKEVFADGLILEDTVEIWSRLLHLFHELNLVVLVGEKPGSDLLVQFILSEFVDTNKVLRVSITDLLEN